MKASKCPIRGNVYSASHPSDAAPENTATGPSATEKRSEKNKVSFLYQRARTLELEKPGPVTGPDLAPDLSAKAHGALEDVQMTVFFATQPYFWKLRKNKGLCVCIRGPNMLGGGMKSLEDVWKAKQVTWNARLVLKFFASTP